MDQAQEEQPLSHPMEQELDSLSQELLNTYQEINVLYRIAEKLSLATDLDEIARIILDEVIKQIPVKRASIMLFDPVNQKLTVLDGVGLPPELGAHPSISLQDSIVQEVVTQGKALLVNDLRDYPHLSRFLKDRGYDTFSMLSVPLLSVPAKFEEEVLGTINLSDKRDDNPVFSSRDQKLLSAAGSQAAIAIKRTHLFQGLKRSQQETEEAFLYLVQSLARAAESNDDCTGNHIVRVGKYSQTIAAALGLPQEFCEQIYYYAQMHDVGKIHIHPDILGKPGKLTEEEWRVMMTHCQEGANILGKAPKLMLAREIALSHHERWDGTGYPRKLQGEVIPLAGRITMLADIYDALRTARPYKPAFDHDKAHAIITQGDGRVMPAHFDPQVLAVFKELHGTFAQICEELPG